MKPVSEHAALLVLQEEVLRQLQGMVSARFDAAKLCGGTALARCWLGHRVSFDLDFFLPEGFRARDLAIDMKKAGIDFATQQIVDDPRIANQLHGHVRIAGEVLNVSFIEDAYFDVFPAVERAFGALRVSTEAIDGLYHRKLRTVSGSAGEGAQVVGGRQKARDLFDLFVLATEYRPIQEFMAQLPYAFPQEAFANGLAGMPWFDLIDEFEQIRCDPKWNAAKDVAHVQNFLFAQIGALALPKQDEAPITAPPGRARKPGRAR